MDRTHDPQPLNDERANDEQAKLWNGPAAQAWVDAQELLDGILEPFAEILVEPLRRGPATRVLDVGCGTGATTLAAAHRLGAAGCALGIDLSAPMIAFARARAERQRSPATFVVGDAQLHRFEPASFDLVLSRFGVLFFGDPVAAFANLHRASRAGAELRFVAWRSPAENPFMTTAERAASPLLPNLPPRDPAAPGQFAFADRRKVHGILAAAGWSAIDITPLDVPCTLPERELLPYLTRMGPVGLALREADEPTRTRVLETLRGAFDPYVQGSEVRFSAACWLVAARAG